MFCRKLLLSSHWATSVAVLAVYIWITLTFMYACGAGPMRRGASSLEYTDGVVDRYALAVRFAPKLYLHPDEPYEVIAIIPVFHPAKPIIAYHLFFEKDAVLLGSEENADHEIIWVEYDPVSLKIADVITLWHRAILRTDSCLMNAKASAQRPRVDVQWGQHGILPYHWKTLMAARPRLELIVYYNLVHHIHMLPKLGTSGSAVVFEGTYDDYLTFTVLVDAADYFCAEDVLVAEYPDTELRSKLGKTFRRKKEWPGW